MGSTAIKTGQSTTATRRSAPMSDCEFIVNGVDANQKFSPTDLTKTTDHGIRTAPSAPTPADGAAGAPGIDAGLHYVYVVFVNSLTMTPSPIGTKASWTAAGAKKLSLTNIPVATDPQCNRRDIWMSLADDPAAASATFYLLGTIANNTDTSAVFDMDDVTLAAQPAASEDQKTTGGKPPISRFIVGKWSRLWEFGVDDGTGTINPNEYAYSLQDGVTEADYKEAEMFHADDRDIVDGKAGDGDYITAVNADFAHAIVIWKRNKIYFLTQGTIDDPNDPANQFPDVRQIPSDGVGCIADLAQNGTIAVNLGGEHRIFFPWYSGIWSLDEQGRLAPLADEIVTTWLSALNPAMRRRIEMGYDPQRHQLLVGVAPSDVTVNARQLRYDLLRKTWFVDPGVAPSVYAKVEESGGEGRVYFGDPYGFLNVWWEGNYAGESSGTLEGTVAAGSTTTVVQVTGGGLKTSGGGLRGVPVWVDTPNGREYRFITSNTATAFTIDSGSGFGALSAAPATGASFKIAYIGLRAKTGRHHHGAMDLKKLWFYVTLFLKKQSAGDLTVKWYLDGTLIETFTVDMTEKEFHKIALFATRDRINVGHYGELEFVQEGVNQPVTIRDIVFDAIVTQETG